jgi:hypothetical protein
MANSAPILNFTIHNGRLATIARFAHFTTSAIREFEGALPKRESYIAAREKIVDSFKRILSCFEDPPELDVEKLSSQIDSAVIISEPSKELVYNLSLVMLCTEVEIFLEHLIDVILMKDPRRLKDIASQKQLTAAELVDLKDYDNVMREVRRKAIKEIINSNTRDVFVKHLGNRIGLFEEKELVWKNARRKWGLSEIEAAWKARHEIVHEGRLPCTKEYFQQVLGGFLWLVAFLSFRARKEYAISVDDDLQLNIFCKDWFKIS